MIFACKCLNQNNKIVKINIEASSIDEIKTKIASNSLRLISFSEVGFIKHEKISKHKKLSNADLEVFCSKLYFVLESGTNIIDGFALLKKQKLNKKTSDIFETISQNIQNGLTLSEAMESMSGVFPEILINSVKNGEVSGNLPEIFDYMYQYYKNQNLFIKRVKSSMVQPIVTLVAGLSLIIFFMTMVIPELIKGMEIERNQLPFLTLIVLNIMDFFKYYYPYVILFAGFSAIIITNLSKKQKVKKLWHRFLLKIPIIKDIIVTYDTYRTATLLHLFSKSGIPLVNALQSLKGSLGNEVAKECINTTTEEILRGEPLYSGLKNHKFFDEIFIEFVKVGETTGKLNDTLLKLHNDYKEDIKIKTKKYLSIVELSISLLTGAVMVILIVSIAIPMFSLVDYIK